MVIYYLIISTKHGLLVTIKPDSKCVNTKMYPQIKFLMHHKCMHIKM